MGTDYVVRLTGKDDLSNTIKNVKKEVTEFGQKATQLEKINAKFERITNSTAPLKRQLKDLQSLMAKMNLEGLNGSEEFVRIAQEAGRLKDAINDASDATKRYASDTMALQATVQVFQGVAAAATIATGVMALFGNENEDVAQAIKKVQSTLAILNGVQTIANMLNKDSIITLKVKQIMQKANAVATTVGTTATVANTTATAANTLARKAWNITTAVSKALLGDFTGLLILGGAALVTYAIATDKGKDATEEMNEETKKAEEIQKSYTNTLSSTYAQLMVSYVKLKNEWKSLSTEQQKTQWIKDNRNELKSLGVEVNGVNDAENFFNRNTSTVVNGFKKRAQAAALMAKLTELYKRQMKLIDQKTEALASGNFDAIEISNELDKVNGEIDKTVQRIASIATTPTLGKPSTSKTKSISSNKTEKANTKPFDYADAFRKVFQKNEKVIDEHIKTLDEKLAKANETYKKLMEGNSELGISNPRIKAIQDEITANKQLITELVALQQVYKELGRSDMVTTIQHNIEGLSQTQNKLNGELSEAVAQQRALNEQTNLATVMQTHWDEQMQNVEGYSQLIGNVGNAFNSMGSAIGDTTGQMLQFAATAIQNVATILPMIQKLIIAKQAEAMASGTAEGAKMPFPFNMAAIATIIATILSTFASLPKFSDGGIVGGNSFYGDKLLTRVNSGEAIFNKRQQRNLYNLIDNNNSGGQVEFKIRGNDLYGCLKNFNKTTSFIGKNIGIK